MSVGPADPKSLQALPTWVVGSPILPGVRIAKLLQGEYLIKSILGEGELGVTYEAENARLKRKFAVLMLKRELRPTQGMMLQVRDDLRRAEPLQSVGIMPVKMIVDHMMIPGFATELLEGETLRARLSRGPLPPPRALAIVLSVARALDALHKAGAVHGDLRPENIFLVRPGAKSSFAGRVMVVEHSLHPLRRRSQGLDDQLPLYKLMYRPPECLAGERGPHIGGDVFVLGAILHECLTGKPAFYDEVADFVIDNLNQPPKPIPANPASGLTPELAATLSVLVASACARDPEVRTPDMAEIILAIVQVAQGAGLVLPAVITEEPQAVPAAPPTPTASRMNRLLHRMSGVFPQVRLPPVTDPVGTPSPASAAKSGQSLPRASALPDPSTPASVSIRPQATTMPPIVAPRTKVTMLLQKLSGVFPVLQVSPDGNLETLSSSDPKIAGPVALANQQAQAALGAAPVPGSQSAITQPALTSPLAMGQAATLLTGLDAPTIDDAKVASGATAVPAGEPGAQSAGSLPKPAPEPAAGHPTLITSPSVSDKTAGPDKEQPKTVPPILDAAPGKGAAASEAATVPAESSATAAALPQAPVSPVSIPETPLPAKNSEVAKALALLRLQQQARATGQPVDLQKAGLAPATPEAVVPSFMAPPPAAAPASAAAPAPAAVSPSAGAPISAAAPNSPVSQATPSTNSAAAPSTASPRPTTPPVAAEPSGMQALSPAVVSASAQAAQDAADLGWMGIVSDSVTPAVSLPPSSLSPTHERPRAGPPSPADLALESTLQPNELVDFVDADKPRVPRGPKTLSEIPTRPAAMAGLAPIPAYNEAKTQPALRSLPITEQATQAKLSPDLFHLATSIKGVGPDFSGMAPASALPAEPVTLAAVSAAGAPAAPPTAAPVAPPVAAHAAPTPAVGTPAPRLDSLRELEGVSLLMEEPPSATPPPVVQQKATPSRPPRVSQLIKALQQGHIDQFQALQQASGAPNPPASPTVPAPSTAATGGAVPALATGSQAVVGPGSSSPSGPTPQGRVSPGLMALAPPPATNGDSPWGTATQHVVPAPPPLPPVVGLRGFLLRNQEVMAALLGALLVLLCGIAFLLLR